MKQRREHQAFAQAAAGATAAGESQAAILAEFTRALACGLV